MRHELLQADEDFTLAAITIWREAAGEGIEGMRAVLHVILNRTKDSRWGLTVMETCTQPWQFSCFNAKDPIVGKWPRRTNPREWQAWRDALLLCNNPGEDPTFGSNHYYNPKAVVSKPKWATNETFMLQIGRHRFHRR